MQLLSHLPFDGFIMHLHRNAVKKSLNVNVERGSFIPSKFLWWTSLKSDFHIIIVGSTTHV